MSGYEYWGGFHFWWIFPLVMMVFCFLFMRRCGRRMWWSGPFRDRGESPMDILNKRYARGEIDKQEYHEKREVIESRV
jgi:putative membrane protein